MDFKTKLIHAGVKIDPQTGSILTPIYQSTTFVQKSVDEYLSKGYSYSRSCLLYTSPSPRDATLSRMPSSA